MIGQWLIIFIFSRLALWLLWVLGLLCLVQLTRKDSMILINVFDHPEPPLLLSCAQNMNYQLVTMTQLSCLCAMHYRSFFFCWQMHYRSCYDNFDTVSRISFLRRMHVPIGQYPISVHFYFVCTMFPIAKRQGYC